MFSLGLTQLRAKLLIPCVKTLFLIGSGEALHSLTNNMCRTVEVGNYLCDRHRLINANGALVNDNLLSNKFKVVSSIKQYGQTGLEAE